MSFGILRAATLRQAARAGARNARVGFRGSFRSYSSEVPPAAKKSNTGLFVGLGAVAGVGLAYYVYANESDTVKSGVQAAKVKANFVPTKEDYQKVYNDITELLDAENYDDGSYGPVLVRLAWHASGTYDKETKTGGSNYATMRFAPESEHGANKGLQTARSLLEQVKEKHPWISYGDLWTLGGVAAIQEMGGPKIPWRPGRIDGFSINATPDGRLPDATQGSDHVRAIFGRMGFNDQEMVALIGAHALGRCHRDRSGFEGPWTFSPITVTNDFYKLLFSETWRWKKWDGPKQLEDKATGSLMMLPTDYVLVTDKSFKKYAKAYAQDQDVWFKDFSAATARLFELGVPEQQWVTAEPWSLKTVDEQADEKKKD